MTLNEESDATYQVALSTEPTGPVTVRVTVSGNPDVTVDPTSLTFTADTWDTEQMVTVSAAHDDDAADDTAELRHAASGADYAGVTALSLTVAVTDNDTPGGDGRGGRPAENRRGRQRELHGGARHATDGGSEGRGRRPWRGLDRGGLTVAADLHAQELAGADGDGAGRARTRTRTTRARP